MKIEKIDLSRFAKEYEAKLTPAINNATLTLLAEVIQKSPVDTWAFLKWNKRQLARKEGDKIVWSVYNDSELAFEIENGFRKTEVNWHKWRKKGWPVIFRWVWATPFLRTYIEKREEIINNIKKEVLW